MIKFSLTKKYKDHIVKHENVIIKEGVNFFVGKNGSGKSTILKLLSNTIFGDCTIDKLNNVGYMSEDSNLPKDITIFEFLEGILSCENVFFSDVLNDILKEYQLDDKKDTLLQHLSKGMKQKINFIQATFFYHEWILLDEPISHMDEFMVKEVTRFLKSTNSNCIIATHQIDKFDQKGCHRWNL